MSRPLAAPRLPNRIDLDCQSSGACCAYSSDCPMFDAGCADDGSDIPIEMVHPDGDRMACDADDRCAALRGVIGHSVSCAVYHHRPKVCREFQPGSDECLIIREQMLGQM